MQGPLLLLFVCCFVGCFAQFVSVDPQTRFMVDADGRSLVMHGLNLVFKVPPFVPTLSGPFDPVSSLVGEDFDNLEAWGMTFVRLGVMWPGTMPDSPTEFNTTYLDQIESIVNAFGQRGVFTLIDLHQDVFSRFFCGEGVPNWAATPDPAFPFPLDMKIERENGPSSPPVISSCLEWMFGDYLLSDAAAHGFQSLYSNLTTPTSQGVGLLDAMGAHWAELARRFAENPWVVGYELLNEPFFGDIYTNPSLLKPGEADRVNLAPMYEYLHQRIRAVDDSHIIFFEPVITDQFWPTGLTEPPGGASYANRSVFSYHIYCPTNASGDATNMGLCDLTMLLEWSLRLDDAQRLGCGSFLTEFGAMNVSDAAGPQDGLDNMILMLDEADRRLQSWAYWQWKWFLDYTTQGGAAESLYFADGTLDVNKIRHLARPYAHRIAGVPQSTSFDQQSSMFELTYLIGSTPAPTLVWPSAVFWFPDGFQLTVSPAHAASWVVNSSSGWVVVTHTETAVPGSLLTVQLAAVKV